MLHSEPTQVEARREPRLARSDDRAVDHAAEVSRAARRIDRTRLGTRAQDLVHRGHRDRNRGDRRRRDRDAAERRRAADDRGVGRRGVHEPLRLARLDHVARRHRRRRRSPPTRSATSSARPGTRRTSSSRSCASSDRRTSRLATSSSSNSTTSAAELESRFDALRDSAEAAADAPPSEFLQQLGGLASDFAALQTAISTTVSSLESANVAEESKAELEQAFADAPSCQSLQAAS